MAWYQEIPNRGWIGPYDVIASFDGGVVLAGSTPSLSGDSPSNSFDAFGIKFDGTGRREWEGTWGGEKRDTVVTVVESMGAFVLVGYTLSESAGGTDTLVIVVDGGGELRWQRRYGGVGDEQGVDGVALGDGSFLVLVNVNVSGSYESIQLLKLDPEGRELGSRFIKGPQAYSGHGIVGMKEDSVLVAGMASRQGVVMKVNRYGKIEWERMLGEIGVVRATCAALVGADKVVVGVNVDTGSDVCCGISIVDLDEE